MFAENLAALRKLQKITQEELAEKGGPLSVRQFAFGNNGFNDTICELVKAYYEDVVSDMLPTFGDGVYLVAVCQAIYRSANQDGTWVVVEDREKRKKE